ncbi:Hypothetical predicted protein, partial [Mytilus galloprovincialis]
MISKLKSIRAGHRSAVSRILRRFEERSETEEKPEEDELETILDTLKEKQDILKDLDKNILDSVQEEDIEQEILDTDEYKFNLETKIRKIRETEETHTTDDETERNTINIEHISTIVDTSRTKQKTTGPLKVNETDKSALMWTRDSNKNKRFYEDLQGMGKSKSQFKQLNLYQELDYREKLTRKKNSACNKLNSVLAEPKQWSEISFLKAKAKKFRK